MPILLRKCILFVLSGIIVVFLLSWILSLPVCLFMTDDYIFSKMECDEGYGRRFAFDNGGGSYKVKIFKPILPRKLRNGYMYFTTSRGERVKFECLVKSEKISFDVLALTQADNLSMLLKHPNMCNFAILPCNRRAKAEPVRLSFSKEQP